MCKYFCTILTYYVNNRHLKMKNAFKFLQKSKKEIKFACGEGRLCFDVANKTIFCLALLSTCIIFASSNYK